jgi:hypothetical protein
LRICIEAAQGSKKEGGNLLLGDWHIEKMINFALMPEEATSAEVSPIIFICIGYLADILM